MDLFFVAVAFLFRFFPFDAFGPSSFEAFSFSASMSDVARDPLGPGLKWFPSDESVSTDSDEAGDESGAEANRSPSDESFSTGSVAG